MKFISYSGETIALCLIEPNWQEPLRVEIDLSQNTNITAALSAKETRERFGRTSRYSFEYSVFTDDAAESAKLRLFLQRLKGETVAVPMWMDGVELYSAHTPGNTVLDKTPNNPVQYGTEWIVLSPDASTYEIVTVSAIDLLHITLNSPGLTLSWPAGTMMYPLLFGRIATRPQFDAETDELLSGRIRFNEDSTYARRLNVYAQTLPVVGANIPAFSTKPLWNIQPNHVQLLDRTELDILIKQIGYGRQAQQQVYSQPVRTGLDMEFYQDSRANIAAITAFFMDRYGPTKTFMIPTFRGDLRLTQDLPVTAGGGLLVYIEFNQDYIDAFGAGLAGIGYLAFVDSASVDPAKVDVVDGTQLTLQTAVTTAHKFNETKASRLLFARFAEAKLTWIYHTDGQASCRIKFIERSEEYAAPIADQTERAFLFRFKENLPTPQYWYFTSYENSLVLGGGTGYPGTYVPGPFDFGDITQGTRLDEEKLEITSFDFSSTANPLRKLLEFSLEGTLSVDVLQVDVNNLAAAPTVIFSGDAGVLEPKGKEWKVPFLAFGQFFKRQFPRMYFQRICNVPLYSAKCGVVKASFLTDGTLYAIAVDGSYIDIAQIGGHPDPASKPTNYFAIGHFETGTGSNYEARTITQSQTISGKLRLWFAKPLKKAVVGSQVVNIYPGCNGTIETCIGVYNNQANHRGFPYMPDRDPTTRAGRVQTATGGKK